MIIKHTSIKNKLHYKDHIPRCRNIYLLLLVSALLQVNFSAFTQTTSLPVEDWSKKLADPADKLHYIHDNPVRNGLVLNDWEYVYSSAMDYHGKKGLVNIGFAF